MASRYDAFWRSRLDAVEKGLAAAADGVSDQTVDVSGLTENGSRLGWSGSILVDRTADLGTSGTAAHVKSLARLLISEKVLEQWPDTAFRLSVNRQGDTLTIRLWV